MRVRCGLPFVLALAGVVACADGGDDHQDEIMLSIPESEPGGNAADIGGGLSHGWAAAPWREGLCLRVNQTRHGDSHSALPGGPVDFDDGCYDPGRVAILCPFERCRVVTPCRRTSSGWGTNACLVDEATGAWCFVSHLDGARCAVANGAVIEAEALVGFMGNTGNVRGTPGCRGAGTHLHLECGAAGSTVGGVSSAFPLPVAVGDTVCAARETPSTQPCTRYYRDADGDGHGERGDPGVCTAAPDEVNRSLTADDCNDRAPAIHPGAREGWDLLDEDCDGLVDDAGLTEMRQVVRVTSATDVDHDFVAAGVAVPGGFSPTGRSFSMHPLDVCASGQHTRAGCRLEDGGDAAVLASGHRLSRLGRCAGTMGANTWALWLPTASAEYRDYDAVRPNPNTGIAYPSMRCAPVGYVLTDGQPAIPGARRMFRHRSGPKHDNAWTPLKIDPALGGYDILDADQGGDFSVLRAVW